MRPRVIVFGTVGLLGTAFGIGLLLVPSVLLGLEPVEAGVSLVGERDPTTLLLATSVLAGLSVLVVARSGGGAAADEDGAFAETIATPPEDVTVDSQQLVGEQLDQKIRYGMSVGGEPLRDVRDWLATAAVYACTEDGDHTQAEAKAAVEQGTWTDDRLAAAFLAGPDGPSATIPSRLRLWLAPVRERRRRIERTLAAIEQVAE